MSTARDLASALDALDAAEDFIMRMPESPDRREILARIDLCMERCERGHIARLSPCLPLRV